MKNKSLLAVFVALLMVPAGYSGAIVDIDLETRTDVGGSRSNSTTSIEANAEIYGGVNTYDEKTDETSLETNSSGIAVVSAIQVSSDNDLAVFSENMSIRNSNVAKVVVSSESDEESRVTVVYKHRGKLFGFIPVTIKSATSVKAETDDSLQINSGLSWWGFLVAKENYAREEVESRIENNNTVKVNMKVSASASAKAKVAEAVVAELGASATLAAASES